MHKLAQICIERPVFATMLVLAITVIGAFSFFALGVDLLPKVDLPTVIVTVNNPGASPEQIETEITQKVEAAVNTISGIDELRSYSREGSAQVVVTFVLEKDGDVAAQEVRDKVNLVLGDLPETAKAPIIQKLDPDAQPVMQIVVSAPRPLRDITEIADNQVKERLENIDGVGEIRITGGRKREIRVRVDPDRMSAYGLTVNDVANALRLQNLELPGGRVSEGGRELTVRAMGRITDSKDFNEIAVAARGDYAVKIRDIGVAEDSAEEQRSASILNEEPAVTLVVSKQSGENTVAVADAVKERVEEIRAILPKDVRMEVMADQSVFIKAAVDSIQKHLIEGSLLAAIVIFFFLSNLRSTFIAAIAIPTSIISTFGLMAAMGYTLNQITMLALTLMVGVVVDDAIIVLENIYRYIEEKGMPPFQAAIEGTREIGLAVMATTLSLLAVFVPVGFMGGIVGRFMSSFGLTAAFAIAVSLLVSFTLTPMLCSRMFKVMPKREQGHGSKDSRFFRPIDRVYTAMLRWSMAHRKTVVAICVAVVLAIVPMFMVIGKNFTPQDDRGAFEVSIRAPEGTSLPSSINIATQVARDIRKMPGVTDTLTNVGGNGEVNSTGIYVKLAPAGDRELSQAELMERTRELLKRYAATLRTSVQEAGGISAGARNAQVQYVLTGPDLDQLSTYSDALLAKMKQIPDVVDADTSLITGKPELRLEIDRKRAADLGVRVSDIAQALNTMVAGEIVSSFNAGTEQYDVRLQAAGDFRSSVAGLNRITVPSESGPLTLDNVVSIHEGTSPSSIERMNRQRQVTLSSNVAQGGSQAGVIAAMDAEVDRLNLAPGYSSGLAGMSRELGRTAYYFVLAIALSFIFMYMVLAAQFESFIHPVTILLTLPLAIPFGILSLLVMNQTINIFSGLGMLLLFGIVKKNAILQIDHTNGLRAGGMSRDDAIIQANRDRLRPILMTTIALVAGMLPLVISSGPGTATNRSIGVLVVGGQTLCLLLTLLAVPVFYSYFEDLGESPLWQRIGRRSQTFWDRVDRGARRIGSRVGLRIGSSSGGAAPGGTRQ
jgi:HAE1 family hydrophobic/amphiphilic exporter-1